MLYICHTSRYHLAKSVDMLTFLSDDCWIFTRTLCWLALSGFALVVMIRAIIAENLALSIAKTSYNILANIPQ